MIDRREKVKRVLEGRRVSRRDIIIEDGIERINHKIKRVRIKLRIKAEVKIRINLKINLRINLRINLIINLRIKLIIEL